ncbi:proteoglycan 4-like [Uloborus diversus]|uniref:proteoglycan 4-like n=1 Tax=Uloborus diversus TaxID=327109 RepID=UPI002408FA40|nr:proteoglycan 4-like [Uloborus diversus]
MLLGFMALVTAAVHMVSGQDRGGGQIIHRGEPDTQSVIVTDKTRAFLSCENGDMVVKVNFSQPFRGLVYAHRSRNSPCRMNGSGQLYVELRIPLKGCGTWQESPRVFVNNITIRFHPALELEEDETKTVVCRYPPPLTPSPGSIQVVNPPTVGPSPVPTRLGKARLSELEILIIICLLLFLSLLTLGIGIAYFCLRRRNIRIVRKHTISSAPPSQITRLSSSNLQAPPSSLLSSVLGHTVRIPRAVPYSAPGLRAASSEQAYEDYPASSSTAETSSGELSETSASSSSLAEDKVDSSRRLLYKKAGPRSFLFIPKAILRKTSPRRWPSVHHTHSKIARPSEREDQIVTTVLGSEVPLVEEDQYWRLDETEEDSDVHTTFQKKVMDSISESPVPVYAQVEKPKKVSSARDKSPLAGKSEVIPPKPTTVSTPAVSKTTEEVTKNTTVTTSVRREVKETVLSATKRATSAEPTTNKDKQVSTQSSGKPLVHHPTTTQQQIAPSPKKLLIRDVADVFVTTTVETESRELKTKTTKDTIQSRRRRQQDFPEISPPPNPPPFPEHLLSKPISPVSPELVEPSELTKKSSPPEVSDSARTSPSTDGWNVVIRQKKPPPSTLEEQGTDLDSMEQNEDTAGREDGTLSKPQFDVKIRTIPPTEIDSKPPDEMIAIPPLEMPQTVSRLKEALMSGNQLESKSPPTVRAAEKRLFPKATPKAAPSQRTVRWMDEPKESEGSTDSSSDSFHSAESLRERSSSEVLEVAPTLPSQHRGSAGGRPSMLERSSSEIETSPEDSQVRWIGGVVPPLESLARFPSTVVARAGFFSEDKGGKDRPG